MTVTVNGVIVYSRDYQERRLSAAAEAENKAIAAMRAETEAIQRAAEEESRAADDRLEAARAMYYNNHMSNLPYVRVPWILE